jgi:hypothetical protein
MIRLPSVGVNWLYGGKKKIKVGTEPALVFELRPRNKEREVSSILVKFELEEGMEAVVAAGDPDFPEQALPGMGPHLIRHPQDYWQWMGGVLLPPMKRLQIIAKCNKPTCCTVEVGGY